MKKNMGAIDRVFRIAVATVLGILLLKGVIIGWLAVVLGIVAIAFLLTGLVSTCPIYLPFGLSSRK